MHCNALRNFCHLDRLGPTGRLVTEVGLVVLAQVVLQHVSKLGVQVWRKGGKDYRRGLELRLQSMYIVELTFVIMPRNLLAKETSEHPRAHICYQSSQTK